MAEYRSKDLALLGHCAALWKDMIIKRWIWPQEAHKLKSFFVLFCFVFRKCHKNHKVL